ncbi:MAG: hypothetical protein SWJ54_21005 [Cyanobacteriota bacterium]|nr:hypothetical protein [Cyanobacteriota bacterium]
MIGGLVNYPKIYGGDRHQDVVLVIGLTFAANPLFSLFFYDSKVGGGVEKVQEYC